MTTTTTHTLTPAQFTAARALAKAYSHLWSAVPDGTYDLTKIGEIASEWQHPMLPAGIDCPTYSIDAGMLSIEHTTGSGRLHWKVRQSGNVCLEVHRPSDLSPERAQFARTMAYAAISNVQPPDDSGICVARMWLINDDSEQYDLQDDYVLCTSDHEQGEQESFVHDPNLRDDLLFERHVFALVRPIVALLTANAPERAEDEDYDEWKAKYIRPAIEQAKYWLAPLFEKALPDPYVETGTYDKQGRYEKDPAPQTYWTRPEPGYSSYLDPQCLYVCHLDQKFPVESEKTAVHAVLLLRQHPEMDLIDALRIAIESSEYRPREEVK
jgi:hypothetical protein